MYEYETDVSNLLLILPHDEQSCDDSLYLLREQLGLLKSVTGLNFKSRASLVLLSEGSGRLTLFKLIGCQTNENFGMFKNVSAGCRYTKVCG